MAGLRFTPFRVAPGRPADRGVRIEYTIDNALFQWEDGERRVRDRGDLEAPTLAVVEELRRRLGSAFTLAELAAVYAEGTDWAADTALGAGAGTQTPGVVDAAFGRYAREASDYAGGLRR
jgi:hypothetical protein